MFRRKTLTSVTLGVPGVRQIWIRSLLGFQLRPLPEQGPMVPPAPLAEVLQPVAEPSSPKPRTTPEPFFPGDPSMPSVSVQKSSISELVEHIQYHRIILGELLFVL